MMMRNNDFEQLVQAKTALKSHVIVQPTKSIMVRGPESEMPDDEDFDVRFNPREKSMAQLPALVNAAA